MFRNAVLPSESRSRAVRSVLILLKIGFKAAGATCGASQPWPSGLDPVPAREHDGNNRDRDAAGPTKRLAATGATAKIPGGL